jgi:hypothetical protein
MATRRAEMPTPNNRLNLNLIIAVNLNPLYFGLFVWGLTLSGSGMEVV